MYTDPRSGKKIKKMEKDNGIEVLYKQNLNKKLKEKKTQRQKNES